MSRCKLTPELEKRSISLAKRGFSDIQICQSVGIAQRTLYSEKYAHLLQAIRSEKEELREKVFNDLISRSESDSSSTATTYLAEKLKLFKPHYKTAKPKTVTEAIERISQIYADVASGEITGEFGNYLIGYLEKYIKAKEVGEISVELEEIKNILQKEGLLK